MIKNERNPSWVPLVTLFLPVAQVIPLFRQTEGGPSGPPFRVTGVVRIGPAGVGRPVVPAPDRSREEPGPRITTAAGGRGARPHLTLPLSPRVPIYPQGVRRIRKAAELLRAAQGLDVALSAEL